jgi:uracil-DNA glycosylase
MNTHKTLNELYTEVIGCRACPRLVAWREEVAETKRRAYQDEEYWGKPVPGFGDPRARLLLLGLAPGAHGANRTGRAFTGDSSGNFLYGALHRNGFATQPTSTHRQDGLQLLNCYITGVARCVPPQNRPSPEEIANCRTHLKQEMMLLDQVEVIVALGQIAFDGALRLLRELDYNLPRLDFGHGLCYELAQYDSRSDGPLGRSLPYLVASYHPSRQNTQTGRLTEAMMDSIFAQVRTHLKPQPGAPRGE